MLIYTKRKMDNGFCTERLSIDKNVDGTYTISIENDDKAWNHAQRASFTMDPFELDNLAMSINSIIK